MASRPCLAPSRTDRRSAPGRARIKLIANRIGYRPNRAGLRLKTGKTNVIAAVLNPGADGSSFFSDFAYGISDALAGTSYHLVATPCSLSDPMAPIRYIFETGSADGEILSRIQPDDLRVRYLLQHGGSVIRRCGWPWRLRLRRQA